MGKMCTHTKFVDDIKLVVVLTCMKAGKICRDLDRLDGWATSNHMAPNKAEELHENCPAKKGPEMTMSQQYAQVAKDILACVRNNMANRNREATVPLQSSLGKLHFQYCFQFWTPLQQKDFELLKYVQRRAIKLVKRVENKN